jgi:hypothetical protein
VSTAADGGSMALYTTHAKYVVTAATITTYNLNPNPSCHHERIAIPQKNSRFHQQTLKPKPICIPKTNTKPKGKEKKTTGNE